MAKFDPPPSPIAFSAFVERFDGDPPTRSLAEALNVPAKGLGAASHWLLPELDKGAPLQTSANELALNIRGFASFQDLMEVTVEADAPMTNRHYCYYEACSYLREIGMCVLHGNAIAALTLLRPFLELAVLHLYWRGRGDGYAMFYEWFEGKRDKPHFRNAIDELETSIASTRPVPGNRLAQLKDATQAHYKVACSYNHTPRLGETMTVVSGGSQPHSIDAVAVATAQANLVLRQTLYWYVLAYPSILFPRELASRFGYGGGPIGLFAPPESAALVRAAIGMANAEKLTNMLSADADVRSRLEWFDGLPALDFGALEDSWTRLQQEMPAGSPSTDHRERELLARAQLRSIGWVFNYIGERQEWSPQDDAKLAKFESRIMNW